MISGRYSLVREIGRGGTGPVWLGRDEVLGRPVALKRIGLLPGHAQTDDARAEREARLSARLSHPHVVAVFDVVEEGEARWLVMEYVEGAHLGELVRTHGAFGPDEAAPLLWQLADALVAAHDAGIVHRDVKPSNILLDQYRQVKLNDFGIARAATDASLTQTGMLTGSPGYLAPETASGGRGGEASDVWSLGATAFHLLAGRPPYETGENVLGALYRIVHEEPPRLSDAGWLTPLLEATMVRDPAQRWSMRQVRDFLESAGARTPVVTPAPVLVTSSGSLGEPTEHHPVLSAPAAPAPRRTRLMPVLVGLCLLLVVGLGIMVIKALDDGTPAAGGSKPTAAAPAKPVVRKPTVAGMESFIRNYVSTVADDPDKSWQMLTPKFQVESGGIEKYRAWWDRATNGRVLSISADPENLTVSYQVRFANYDHNGPGPTVLDLKYDNGRYLIDGERSAGFVPAS